MSTTVTIYDVARRAGVSHQTVSRVLNGRPGVADATRAEVEAAVAALAYVPEPSAARLGRRGGGAPSRPEASCPTCGARRTRWRRADVDAERVDSDLLD